MLGLELALSPCDTHEMLNTDHTFTRSRSIKADVLVNCARIGFKP
jgi:hypothetical protein